MAINRTKVLESAQKFLAKNQYDKAIVEYLKLLEDDPKDVRTLLKVGDLYTRKGARPEACEAYRKVAAHYAAEGFYLKAVAVYKQILSLDPTHVDVQLELAEMHIRLNMRGEAVQVLDSVARSYARDGDVARTIDVLKRMGQLEPESVPVRIRYAEALSQAGRKEEAADAFGVGAALLKQQGRVDDYLKVAERLLFHRPNDIVLSRELATLYLQRRDPKRALAKLQICFQSDRRNIHTLDLLAHAFEQLGQLPKTISVYKEMAKILLETEEHEQRAQVLGRILELDPQDREARQALAVYAPSTRGSIAPAAPPPVAPEAPPRGDSGAYRSGAAGMPASDGWNDAAPTPYVPSDSAVSYVPKPAGSAADEPPELTAHSQEERYEREGVAMVSDEDDDVVLLDEDEVLEEADILEEDDSEDVFAPESSELRAQPLPAAPRVPSFPAAPGFSSDPMEESAPMVEIISRGASPGAPSPVRVTSGSRPASIPPSVAVKAQIARLLTECEVFERYGLRQKVIEQLNRVLVLDSRHQEARERLKETFLALGQIPEAVEQLHALAEIVRNHDPASADRYLSEAALLAGDMSGAHEEVLFVDESEVSAPALPAAPARAKSLPPAPSAELPPVSPAEFEAAPLHASPPGEESEARARSMRPPSAIEETLDEVEFFLQQGLHEEARVALSDALEEHPENRLLLDKLEEVAELAAEVALSQPPARASVPPGTEDESFLLAEKLAEELDEVAKEEDIGSDVIDVETVFEQFKKGVEATVSKDDSATHYDLGIAYMEMGLHDDAVHEFDLARLDPTRECAAYTMIGTCHMRKGDAAAAVEAFKRGLAAPKRTEREEVALTFELAQAYEGLKDIKEALTRYRRVKQLDPSFREVDRRIAALENSTGSAPGPAVPDQEEIDRAFDDLIAKD